MTEWDLHLRIRSEWVWTLLSAVKTGDGQSRICMIWQFHSWLIVQSVEIAYLADEELEISANRLAILALDWPLQSWLLRIGLPPFHQARTRLITGLKVQVMTVRVVGFAPVSSE